METMPAVFFGHGNPMNALASNAYTKSWSALGAAIPRPRAILAVSAHWYIPRTAVTGMANPRTIHDFGGFPDELSRVSYPAPGDPSLAKRVQSLLAPLDVPLDDKWGLDHGTWSVLCHVYPKADIPVVQLSIDRTKPSRFHYELAAKLGVLRDEGVLVIGSGNVVHNLHAYAWGATAMEPYDWAVRFEARLREHLLNRSDQPLVAYESIDRDAVLSVPTPDHYLPLLYVVALRREGDAVSFPVEGFDGGSISMISVRVG